MLQQISKSDNDHKTSNYSDTGGTQGYFLLVNHASWAYWSAYIWKEHDEMEVNYEES